MHSSDPTPDQRRPFGDYVILRVLGQGGMGTVYEAEEQLSRRRVALKILRSELSGTGQGRRQFVAEMGILASLDDPHIVRCLHCAEIEGQLVMALEYLEGQTLRELLNARGALPWTEVASYAWQIASALRVAHSREPAVIHRDLKPENVMRLADGRVKVMDFGIAKIVQTMAGNTTNNPAGTLRYMSPEQIDARSVDGRSDLFALGLVMWELLAGRGPFDADSPRLLLEQLCTAPTPQLPDYARQQLPPPAEQLIMRLLEKDPNARPRDANEVLATLGALRFAPTVAAQPSAPAPPASYAASNTRPAPQQAKFDTIAIVAEATRPQRPARWIAPTLVAGGLVVALVLGWIFIGPLLDPRAPPSDDPAPTNELAAPASAQAPEPVKPGACKGVAGQWRGSWELRTVATKAIKASWVGGSSLNEVSVDVEGCALSGTGRKLLDGKERWRFDVDGAVADDGSAQLHYKVVGRNIEGTWLISPDGSGTWTSAADDVSGTLTVTRLRANQ
ncbi:serine/threonine-protein kinase [Enhygromyxa salina]|uniref:Serine/threonine-protein kinase PrkC n=1 Tax=Enhygromyxa salina TaxID=215803 RepID=A0A2S9YX52_9BACT|nr:serine/threonine-protein kinase [Enhygromyxa salina]PRQ09664.1 Serine/threonine-protein kinase PrkC [Enhygromyxa salina]